MYQPTQTSTILPSFESQIGSGIYSNQKEKTFVDKVLAREDTSEIKEIMAKSELTKEDLSRLLYLLVSTELKLVNLNEKDRYINGKFYVWIREFEKTTEELIDYMNKLKEVAKETIGDINEEGHHLDPTTAELLKNIHDMQIHNVKFLADIFLYLTRSTLSYKAAGFDGLLTSKFEYAYPPNAGMNMGEQQQKKKILGII